MDDTSGVEQLPKEEKRAALAAEAGRAVQETVNNNLHEIAVKNGLSRDIMHSYDTIQKTATEGSFRKAALEKMRPVVEKVAAAEAVGLKVGKHGLEAMGLVLKGAGLAATLTGAGAPLGIGLEVAGFAASAGAFVLEKGARAAVKTGTMAAELGANMAKRTGISERIDHGMDKIFHWKAQPHPVPVRA